MLRTQYRMHPDICAFVSYHFYSKVKNGVLQGQLGTDSCVEKARLSNVPANEAISWYNVEGDERMVSTSLYNELEVQTIGNMLWSSVMEFLSDRKSVLILTFYAAQQKKLQGIVNYLDLEQYVPVMTVDSAQGSEADLVSP